MRQIIPCIETHTCGEPSRFINMFNIPGETITEKQEYIRANLDHFRRALLHEPRGHRHMFGAIITAPVQRGSACGVIWMDSAGYLGGCGHATIALGIALAETGMVPIHQPITNLAVDAPSGLLSLSVRINGGRACETSFQNVPAFSVATERDTACLDPGRFLAETIPDAQIAVIPNAGHFNNLEEPGIFNRTLGNFIQSLNN